MGNDTEDHISSTDDLKYSLIPDGPHPLITEDICMENQYIPK